MSYIELLLVLYLNKSNILFILSLFQSFFDIFLVVNIKKVSFSSIMWDKLFHLQGFLTLSPIKQNGQMTEEASFDSSRRLTDCILLYWKTSRHISLCVKRTPKVIWAIVINNCNLSLVCLLRHKRKQKRHSYMVPATNCQFPE